MLSQQILKLFQKINVDPNNFDHFDYAETFQMLKEDLSLSVQRNPQKRQIIQKFISKAYEKIRNDNPNTKKEKINNFMHRLQINKRIKSQKIEALRFISENYDQKNGQLLFYPYVNIKKSRIYCAKGEQRSPPKSASRNYPWRINENQDDLEQIQSEIPIMFPNLTDQFVEQEK